MKRPHLEVISVFGLLFLTCPWWSGVSRFPRAECDQMGNYLWNKRDENELLAVSVMKRDKNNNNPLGNQET